MRPLPLLAAVAAIVLALAFVVQPGVFPFVAERMEEIGLWVLDHAVPGRFRTGDWYQTVGPRSRAVARAAGLGLAPFAALLLTIAETAAVFGRRSSVKRAVEQFRSSLKNLQAEIDQRLNGRLRYRGRSWQIRLVTTQLQFFRDLLRRLKSVRPRLHWILSNLESRALRIGYQGSARRDGVRAAPVTPLVPPMVGVPMDWFARADKEIASQLTTGAPSSGALVPLARAVEQTLTEAIGDILTAHEPSTNVWTTLTGRLETIVGGESTESIDATVHRAVTATLGGATTGTDTRDHDRSVVPLPIGPGNVLHEVHLPTGVTVGELNVGELLRQWSRPNGPADTLAHPWTGVFEPASYRLEVRVFSSAHAVFGGGS
ncbi:MAG: hypothetical protein ACOCVK_02275 [bacterium]